MRKWVRVIDVAKCENCHNCFMSCKDEHVDNYWPGDSAPQSRQAQSWVRIEGKERGKFPFIDVAYLPMSCMHCDNAPCIKAASNDALMKRPDGIVIIDPVRANGQKDLVSACPYGAITWNESLGVPQKCALCAHLLDEGWKKTRCVQSCPTGALNIYHLEDPELQKMIEGEGLEAYHPEYKTNPRLYYKNLYRFTQCFIGGSVAVKKNGKEECAAGATVNLLKNSANFGETNTDPYGDFKIDHLEEDSGPYRLLISFDGYKAKTMEVNLKRSLYMGTIFLEKA